MQTTCWQPLKATQMNQAFYSALEINPTFAHHSNICVNLQSIYSGLGNIVTY